MKTIVLFACVLFALTAQSQSLKDALYSGKLKADTGAVIRKGDTLKIQENMSRKLADDSLKRVVADSVQKEALAQRKSEALAAGEDTSKITIAEVQAAPENSDTPAPAEASLPKDNNKIWKSYVDTLTTILKTEVLQSNKIKKGSYFVLIDYKINPDGQVSVASVTTDPQNSFLEQNIKDRITLDGPRLNPIIDANGKARTVNRKQTLNLVK